MAQIKRKGSKETPALSTSSLPDIVFMALFFFMATTTMREAELKVQVTAPQASEAQKLEKKSLVSYIYVGPPTKALAAQFGTAPRIQLNGAYSSLTNITEFIASERDKLSEKDRPDMTVSLKIDAATKMGMVTDIKQELRRANALSISYAAAKDKGNSNQSL
ncbi:MAG TPA: biopolymer transporter ExbD [Candidatus Rikenella faecigallinarum]|uniref:Biopolymer transporter ExbD n=1 Tax=Candidatus Rikenella faecigallinarum TaxID=2838745 RepID=A0A9D1QG76_9BACT|nr:biopolymer transporter ExbD [Candidatus Rikenella faecigallinarum]